MKRLLIFILAGIFLLNFSSALPTYIYDNFADGSNNWALWKNATSSFGNNRLSVTESGNQMIADADFGAGGTGGYEIWSENFTNLLFVKSINYSIQWSLSTGAGSNINYAVQTLNQTVFSRSIGENGASSGSTTISLYRNPSGTYHVNNGTAWTMNITPTGRNIYESLSCSGNNLCNDDIRFGAITFETYGVWNNQTFPVNNSFLLSNLTFMVNNTAILEMNLTNVTHIIYYANGTLFNRTTQTITGKSNTTALNFNLTNIGSYYWSAITCGTNTTFHTCYDSGNRTLTLGGFQEEFETSLIEGQSTGINLNITIDGVNQNILSLLTWNNTVTTPSKQIINSTRIRFTSNIVVPFGLGNSTGVNVSHFWRFYLPDGTLNDTTSVQQQTIYSLGFDNCTTFSNLLFNYTMYDEDSIALINGTGSNGTIELEILAQSLINSSQVVNFSRTYNQTNNARVCVSSVASGFRVDSQARYYANNYVVEFYNIQNSTLSASNFPQHIKLFPLLTTSSQEFLITYKDENFLPVEDALITVTRKYVGEGLFRTVEAPLTNEDGQTLVHLVLGDVIYTIQVSKNGRLLGTFDNIVPFCVNIATGECTINLNSFSSGIPPENFNLRNNLSFAWSLNKTTRTISNIFTTTDGSVATVNLTSVVFDNRGNNTACSSSLQTTSGTITCVIPASIGNTTIRANLYKDGQFVSQIIFSLNDTDDTGFGSTGIIMLLILYITIPLMMISSGAGIVIGAILGMLFGAMLNLFDGGTLIGVTSTIIWFIIAGAIVLYKINKERSG